MEKRSNGLLQLWKKKRCLMTEDGLHLYDYKCKDTTAAPGLKEKQIPFEHMVTVDCVENKRGLVYFTIVMSGGKEIDFRCQQEGSGLEVEGLGEGAVGVVEEQRELEEEGKERWRGREDRKDVLQT